MLKSIIGATHDKAVFKRRVQVLSDRIATFLPKSGVVLDVGTGDGTIASRWTNARPGISVEGIDLMVRKWTAIPVRKFNGLDIPYHDKSVDVVTFVDVLHHADSISRLLSEAHRVARQSVIIKDHLAESWFDHATLRFMDWVGNAPHGVVLPYNYQSSGQWGGYFRDAALSTARFDTAIPLYPFPFSLLFGRKLHFIAELKPSPQSDHVAMRTDLPVFQQLEHDPEKCEAVFPRDKRAAFARRSCSNKKPKRDDA